MNTEQFTGRAEVYAKGRPDYSKAAIEAIVGLAPSGAVYANIGAGTGKFTVTLAERGSTESWGNIEMTEEWIQIAQTNPHRIHFIMPFTFKRKWCGKRGKW